MRRRPPSVRSAREGYDLANLECACLIAAAPEKYPEGGLMQWWADVILSKAAAPVDAECGPLFAVVDPHRRRAA